MGVPKVDLITPGQHRRLKVLRLVAVVAVLLVAIGLLGAFLVHWVLGLVALFFAPAVLYLLVLLFEAIVPAD
ncbi:MAG: hypothetical protein OEW85_03595 [Acidimicrobiia bacterium]|nr:hypothetical protein [Acidimicrobiia bacterium]